MDNTAAQQKTEIDSAQKRVAVVHDENHRRAVGSAAQILGDIAKRAGNCTHCIIKPNICGGVPGEAGSYTGGAVLCAVLEVFSGLSMPMYIGEADCSFNSADRMFRALGVYELGKRFGAAVVNLSTGPCIDVAVERACSLSRLRISTLFQGALIVNVPVLKTHPWTGVTIALKNMYGAVYERDKARYHTGLENNIVDINRVLGAHVCIVDATRAVLHGGFKYGLWVGAPPTRFDLVVAGYNSVTVDAVGSRILERDPLSIEHIRLAAEQGMGVCADSEIDLVLKDCSFGWCS